MTFQLIKNKKNYRVKNRNRTDCLRDKAWAEKAVVREGRDGVVGFIPETTLRPGVLGLELTSLTSVSSEVLPTPEQLSSSCRRSSCFRSGASANESKREKKTSETGMWTFLT